MPVLTRSSEVLTPRLGRAVAYHAFVVEFVTLAIREELFIRLSDTHIHTLIVPIDAQASGDLFSKRIQ